MGVLSRSCCLAGFLAFSVLAVESAPAAAGTYALSNKSNAILGGESQLEQIASRQQNISAITQKTTNETPIIPETAVRPDFVRFESQIKFTTTFKPISPDRPDIFGSVALAISHTPLDAQWRYASENHFDEQGPWAPLIASLRALPTTDQLEKVNAWVNAAITFTEDKTQYGENDHWANGADSIRRRQGDCEDYALAKMQMLSTIGFAANDMYLSIVKDLIRRADHAVLIVRSEGRFWVLDNNTNRLVDASSASHDYRPIFTYSAGRAWAHGYRRERYAERTGGIMIAAR